MKLRITIIALVIVGMSAACTQRTCPTYAQEDVKQDNTTKEVNV